MILEQKTFNPALAVIAQAKLCKDNCYPHFAPYIGICWNCNQNIYEAILHVSQYNNFETGIPIESAAVSHITSCPHCSESFCD